ncbi:TPA: T9SS type A sorting domain-containing protein [bacterium]|nr:T9SS type A sorting domain-containing protein [bacterium]
MKNKQGIKEKNLQKYVKKLIKNTKKPYFVIFLILQYFVLIANGAEYDFSQVKFTPNELIIKFVSDNSNLINSFLSKIGVNSYERILPLTNLSKKSGMSRIYKLKLTNANILSIIQKYQDDPAIEYIQPNYLYKPCADKIELNDYFYPEQWALTKIKATKAWEIEKGSKDVVIAVVDTGVDYKHEDLEPRIWINNKEIPDNNIDDDGNGYVDDIRGWDFYDSPDIPSDGDHIDRDNDPMDERGHGTVVAGIIGAMPNNVIGIAGVVWDCRIMPLRAGNRYFEDDDLCASIVYAVDNGADIINMSWGSDQFSYVIRDATRYAYDRGCVLIAAAGNDNQQKVIYPAIFEHVISVGATDNQDKKASFSNYGAGIDIVAPGDRVFGTVPNNHYSSWSGTSMSAPVVAGVTALMLSKRPSLNNRDIMQILKASSDKIDEPLFASIGRVNAEKALLTGVLLTAHISSPNGGQSGDRQFIIKGTASGKDFKNYQLEYTESDTENWRRIGSPGNNAVFDNILGQWDVSRLSEGSYILRLKVTGYNNNAEDRITINVDHTPPKLIDFYTSSRLSGSRGGNIVTIKTDDPTQIILYYRRTQTTIFSKTPLSVTDKIHEIGLSDYFDPGLYECFFVMINSAGLIKIEDNNGSYFNFEAQTFYAPIDGFIGNDIGIPAIYPISKKVDFDDDGLYEIIGMDPPVLDYAGVRIFEKDGEQYNEVFVSKDGYYPRDVGDSDQDGLLEILGNRNDSLFLIESLTKGTYPTEMIWKVEGLSGGQFADTDLDGNIEIISTNINNKTIDIFENRGINSYLRTARLENPTTDFNHLASSIAIGDFNNNGRIEIVCGDIDGDVFIYENIDDDRYELIWKSRINNSYAKSMTYGDFDGDGSLEFAIAFRSSNSGEFVSKLFTIIVFDWIDNDYKQIWSTEIASPQDNIGMTSGDIDNDGIDELITTVNPATYIFKIMLKPSCIWYHSANLTINPVIQDIDDDGFKELLFNVENRFMKFMTMNGDLVRRPWGVKAVPSNETEIEIRWNGLSGAEAYKIYRGTSRNNLRLFATLGLSSEFQGKNWRVYRNENNIDSCYYRDSDVAINIELWYAIVAINPDGRESDFSEKVSAKPNPAPQLLNAIFSKPSTLFVYFNEPMGVSANDETNYIVISPKGEKLFPSSAILDRGDMRVVLTIETLPNGINTLNVTGVRDATGIPIRDSLMLFYVNYENISEFNDLKSAKLYPNPVSIKTSRKVTFCCLPTDSKISIFDMNGYLVNILVVEESDKNNKLWGLDNSQGHNVASGVYIYVIEYNSEIRSGKIAVIK